MTWRGVEHRFVEWRDVPGCNDAGVCGRLGGSLRRGLEGAYNFL